MLLHITSNKLTEIYFVLKTIINIYAFFIVRFTLWVLLVLYNQVLPAALMCYWQLNQFFHQAFFFLRRHQTGLKTSKEQINLLWDQRPSRTLCKVIFCCLVDIFKKTLWDHTLTENTAWTPSGSLVCCEALFWPFLQPNILVHCSFGSHWTKNGGFAVWATQGFIQFLVLYWSNSSFTMLWRSNTGNQQ